MGREHLSLNTKTFLLLMALLSGCTPKNESSSGLVCPSSIAAASLPLPPNASDLHSTSVHWGALSAQTVSGTVQYQRYRATNSSGVKIDYTTLVTLPLRRALVQIIDGNGTAIASGQTNDLGVYSLSYSATTGASMTLRIQARSTTSSSASDGTAPDNCIGASWDIKVVNNSTGNSASDSDQSLRPLYAVDTSFTAGTATVSPTITTTSGGGTTYAARQSAPFALLDSAISGLETVCQGRAAIQFAPLYINWSVDNTSTSGNKYQGNITTSFFSQEGSSSIANLYILGKNDVDTDEFDEHVVAHEFGHYIENKVYRADSIGGSHSLGDSLDPRVAFGEGFGNAFSGMVKHPGQSTNSPLYIDTNGSGQASGFYLDVSAAPSTNDDRGPWSERSMQYLLWNLWDATDGTASSGTYSKIHTVLENDQKVTTGLTSGLTFASLYANRYGITSETLSTFWSGASNLNSPTNALCTGACTGSGDTYSVFDEDNDFGSSYAATRKYKQTTGSNFSSEFWRFYKTLASGANSATAHDSISLGGYSTSSYFYNKFGVRRFYKVVATSTTTTVAVSSITQSGVTCTNNDLLDMNVYYKGTRIGTDDSASGNTASCPSVTFCSTVGATYIIEVVGWGTVGSYTMQVSP